MADLPGCDISFYQSNIDWVKLAGKVQWVYIRAGFGLQPDVKFIANCAAAKAAGAQHPANGTIREVNGQFRAEMRKRGKEI